MPTLALRADVFPQRRIADSLKKKQKKQLISGSFMIKLVKLFSF